MCENDSATCRSLLATAIICAACGAGDPAPDPFSPEVTEVVLEVDYAAGAEPYTGSVASVQNVWRLTGVNLERLFGDRKTVTTPSSLDDMERLDDVSGSSFTREQILDIASRHRQTAPTATAASFYVVFVDGRFDDGSGVRDDVLGVSLGGTTVIAMFKPVIRTSEGPVLATSRFVEQSVLVHEMGHALGLVNNGIPLTSGHHDADNGAHCTNQRCVMYFANEGAADLIDFVADYLETGDPILFGDECLADVDALQE